LHYIVNSDIIYYAFIDQLRVENGIRG